MSVQPLKFKVGDRIQSDHIRDHTVKIVSDRMGVVIGIDPNRTSAYAVRWDRDPATYQYCRVWLEKYFYTVANINSAPSAGTGAIAPIAPISDKEFLELLGELEADIAAAESSCDHEWVTWTGLHGTQTDCTKCKAVK